MSSEAGVRRRAKRLGYYVTKSRQRKCVPNSDNRGRYMLINAHRNLIVLGERYDARLQDIDKFLQASDNF